MTVAFKYPCNGKYIIGVKRDVFKQYICGWIGKDDDFYVMNASSFNNAALTSFGEYETRRAVESNDEVAENVVENYNTLNAIYDVESDSGEEFVCNYSDEE